MFILIQFSKNDMIYIYGTSWRKDKADVRGTSNWDGGQLALRHDSIQLVEAPNCIRVVCLTVIVMGTLRGNIV